MKKDIAQRGNGWLIVLTVLLLSAVTMAQPPAKPNYVFIAVDDLNDWVGVLRGHPQVKTPNIDRLAKRGVTFTNAHTQAPLCNPSRASFLSGLRPSTTGLYTLQPGVRSVPALQTHVMLPQYLAAHGYATFTAGKIYHDGSIKPNERANEFDEWGAASPMPYPAQKFVNSPDPIKAMDWGIFPANDEEQADWKIADSAIQYLQSAKRDKPFFLGVGFRLPHVPCFASQKWFDLYPEDKLVMPPVKANDRDDVPEFAWNLHWKLPEPRLSWLEKNNQWRPLVRAYLATISLMDSQVGRVLDALDASGMRDNTIVVLFSDHGWHLGEKGITGKNTLWERSTRVPLIFAGPGIRQNVLSHRPVELLALYPTLVELSGLPEKKGLDGHSVAKLLKNPNATWQWPALTTHNQNNHSVRSERWRYIRYADGSEELYDHRNDPNEWTNLARDKKHAKVLQEHARWLPATNLPPVAGSAARLLVNQNGVWMWEGKPIRREELER
ncbi:MAG: sulfatase [Blastocatellia bacterium]|nr:sulfatase [Blastocatellia bacterium]